MMLKHFKKGPSTNTLSTSTACLFKKKKKHSVHEDETVLNMKFPQSILKFADFEY